MGIIEFTWRFASVAKSGKVTEVELKDIKSKSELRATNVSTFCVEQDVERAKADMQAQFGLRANVVRYIEATKNWMVQYSAKVGTGYTTAEIAAHVATLPE